VFDGALGAELGDPSAADSKRLGDLGVGQAGGAQLGDGLASDAGQARDDALVGGEQLCSQAGTGGGVADRLNLVEVVCGMCGGWCSSAGLPTARSAAMSAST
jgi:hypothetical protein